MTLELIDFLEFEVNNEVQKSEQMGNALNFDVYSEIDLDHN